MNNRLQVGGLALELDTGTTCTLLNFVGDGFNSCGEKVFGVWLVRPHSEVKAVDNGKIVITGYVESKCLMPLGDKQTQDELAKELLIAQ